MTTIAPPKSYNELVTRRIMKRLRKGIVPRPTKWNEGRHAAPAHWPHYDNRQLVRDTSADTYTWQPYTAKHRKEA